MDNLEEYEKLIDAYRRKLAEVRKAEKKREDNDIILFLDKERNDIHNELRRIGPLIGKGSQDITLDILVSEKDLHEYGLPEFKVLKTKRALWPVDWIAYLDPEGKIIESVDNSNIPKNSEVFIPFAQQEFWHLFDHEGYPDRAFDELERRRRMSRVISLTAGKTRPVEIHSQDTFHNGISLFGIVFASETLEHILAVMREHRKEVSISSEHFNPEQMREDMLTIIKEDLEYILDAEIGECETKAYLINRYEKNLMRHFDFFKDTGEVNRLFERAYGEADRREKEKEVEKEMQEWDGVYEQYPKEIDMPQNESMGKRR